MAEIEHHPCPDIAPDTEVFCNTSSQTTFEKSHTCGALADGGGGGGGPCCVPTVDGYECCSTPSLIDVTGNGFKLTDGGNGVNFDSTATAHPNAEAGRKQVQMTLGWCWIETEPALLTMALNYLAISHRNLFLRPGKNKMGFSVG